MVSVQVAMASLDLTLALTLTLSLTLNLTLTRWILATGSAATQSEAGPAAISVKHHAPGRTAPAESRPAAPVFYESQQSHMEAAGVGAKRARKASCVELPIHQASPCFPSVLNISLRPKADYKLPSGPAVYPEAEA